VLIAAFAIATLCLGVVHLNERLTRPAEADLNPGSLSGVVRWNGAPLSSDFTTGPCAYSVFSWGRNGGGTAISALNASAEYGFPLIAANTYDLYTYRAPTAFISQTTAVVTAGGATTQDIDLSGYGQVHGVVTSGGNPIVNPYLDANWAATCAVGGPDGSFHFLLPEGTWGIAIRTAANTNATGWVPVTVVAGQDTDLGSIEKQAVPAQTAKLQGTVLFGGSPLTGLTAGCAAVTGSFGSPPFFVNMPVGTDGTYAGSFNPTSPFNRSGDVGVTSFDSSRSGAILNIGLTRALTTVANIDVTADAGVVLGTVTVNGVSLSGAKLSITGSSACATADPSGAFKMLLPPGLHTVTVRAPDDALIGTLNLTSVAGTVRSFDSETACAAGTGACASGFWSGTLDQLVLGRCAIEVSQFGSGLTAISGTASCTGGGEGAVIATFNQTTRKFTGVISFQTPAYSVGLNLTLSADDNTLTGTWSCACGSGSTTLTRGLTRSSAYVPAAEGGTLTTTFGDQLTIPSGAIGTGTLLRAIAQPVPAAAPAGSVALSRAYAFGPEGTTFTQPVEAVFHYTSADLAGGLVDPQSLRVYVYDGTSSRWQLMGGTVDTDAKTITVQLTHFSDYALFGSIAAGLDNDGDAVLDSIDNCLGQANADQRNSDANFISNAPYTVDDRTVAASDVSGDGCDADDDNDGIPDATETGGPPCASASAATDPLKLDTDGDRVTDGAECALGSDPANASSKPAIPSAADDTDHDQLSNAFEATIGTDPTKGDTDGDGLQDGWEYKGHGSNPLVVDTDDDLVTDGCEAASLNGDSTVNSGDQGLLSAEIGRDVSLTGIPKLANFDMNKDGAINSGDQGIQATKVLPGKCPAVLPWP
jgi:hypothetical protein